MSDPVSELNAPVETNASDRGQRPLEEEISGREPASFAEKAMAFGALVLPFSWLLVWIRDQLEGFVSKSVSNIVLLIGIVVFLLVVGKVAERIRVYRKARGEA